jgi:hypothetical protein
LELHAVEAPPVLNCYRRLENSSAAAKPREGLDVRHLHRTSARRETCTRMEAPLCSRSTVHAPLLRMPISEAAPPTSIWRVSSCMPHLVSSSSKPGPGLVVPLKICRTSDEGSRAPAEDRESDTTLGMGRLRMNRHRVGERHRGQGLKTNVACGFFNLFGHCFLQTMRDFAGGSGRRGRRTIRHHL